MSGLWNPYAFSVLGQPNPVQTPPSLRFYGATEPTKEQLIAAQHTFAKFCETARLSFVPNPVQQGELPDGAKYRITVVANTSIMQVWPVGTEDDDRSTILNGILRVNGEVEVDGEWRLHEFKENGKQYVNTAALYGDFHGILALQTLCWRAFNRTDLSGAAAILAQFGRGAHVAYSHALKGRSNQYRDRYMGDGVVIGDVVEDGVTKKAVYFFKHQSGTGIVVRRGEILSEGQLGAKLQPQIKSLFGGAPLPPTEYEWTLAYTVISEVAIMSAAGITPGNYHALGFAPMSFPTFATAVGSKDAYFFYQENKWHADGPSYGHYKYSIVLKASFTVGPSYVTASLSTASSKGIYEFALLPVKTPEPSTHVGVIGVTHVAGVLTIFRRETIFDHYDIENGTPFVRIWQQVREYWAGGATGSVITYKAKEWESASGSQTGATSTHTWVGVHTETFSGPADGLPEGLWAIFTYGKQRWTSSGSGNMAIAEKPMLGLGQVGSHGVEGVFSVTKGSRTPTTETGSASASSWSESESDEYISHWVSWSIPPQPYIPFVPVMTTTGPDPDTFVPSSGHNSFKYGGLCRWVNGVGSFRLASEPLSYGPMTDEALAFAMVGTVGFTGNSDHSGSTGTATHAHVKGEGVFASQTLNANGPLHNIPAMTILEKFEDADRIQEVKESGRFGFDSPISFINQEYHPHETPGARSLLNISQFGGHQCLLTIVSTASKGALRYEERYDMGWGSLVNNAYDIHYSPVSIPNGNTYFIGQLQS